MNEVIKWSILIMVIILIGIWWHRVSPKDEKIFWIYESIVLLAYAIYVIMH